jgi:outer membrane protein OmpA-like peptidoglycan-associated protein
MVGPRRRLTDPAATVAVETVPASTVEPAPPVTPPPNPDCAPTPGRTVTELPRPTATAIVVGDYDVPAVELGDVTIPAVHIDGFTIPAQTFDAGCLIEFEATGGCLGAVEMTSVALPEVTIPGFVIDAVVIDGKQVAERIVREPIVLAAASSPAVRLEQDCETVLTGDTANPALIRDELVRPAVIRPEGIRVGVLRPPVCVDGQCSPELAIDDVVVPQASLPEVVVPELVVLVERVAEAPDAQVVETPGQTSYTAPVDVLFDLEAAELRPDAAPALQAIAAAIQLAGPATQVTVEGHTDDLGEIGYNLDLSQRRAQAVTDWLVANGGIGADRITTIGLGEDVPVATNETPEGRALNRRVVISVATE